MFDAYVDAIPAAQQLVRRQYPLETITIADRASGTDVPFNQVSEGKDRSDVEKAYNAAVRAKALDICRAFIPLTQVTNLGVFDSGQTAENMINKMMASPYKEVQMLGLMALEEASQVAPSFLHNVPTRYGRVQREYRKEAREMGEKVSSRWLVEIPEVGDFETARLVRFDPDTDVEIAASILFEGQNENRSYGAILAWVKAVKEAELLQDPTLLASPTLTEIITDALPDRKAVGRNRRHKLPRAFEAATVKVEFHTDWGSWKDISRARPQTNQRTRFTADESYVPDEFREPEMRKVLERYEEICVMTQNLSTQFRESGDEDLARTSDYIALHGNMIRYTFDMSIRQAVFLAELRSAEGGHDLYRRAVQRMTEEIVGAMPYLEPLFAHVDWTPRYGLGRLRGELSTIKKIGTTGGDE